MESPPNKAGLGLLAGLIVFIISLAFLLGYLAVLVLDIPVRLGLPLPFLVLGAAILAAAVLLFAWLFRFRRPKDIAVSTFVTVRKWVKRIPFEKPSGREEPLIVVGPYRFVRHPIYFNIMLLLMGLWLVFDYTFIILGSGFLFLWFYFFLEDLEERELRLLYGEAYEKYASEVPKMVPFTKILRR
jgi:protein-S-isoprenylcysteine O-methyltransferase Ste14